MKQMTGIVTHQPNVSSALHDESVTPPRKPTSKQGIILKEKLQLR
jgi:hypothetical protein